MPGPNDSLRPRVLLIGSDTIHMLTYFRLVENSCDAILLVSSGASKVGGLKPLLVNFSLRNPFTVMKSVRALRKMVKVFRPNIIHIHQANSVAFVSILALRKYKIPIVLTTWGSDVLMLPRKNILMKNMVRYNLQQADFITADANFMAAAIKELVRDKPVIVTTFGVEVSQSDYKKQNLVYSNRLHKPLYNIARIIKDFSEFVKTNRQYKLTVAAEGSETNNLRQLAEELGIMDNMNFVGWVSQNENINYYKQAKYFVSVPSSDGTSVSLLEAMSFGCMPIVSNLPANREWVSDGINGLVVDDSENIFSRLYTVDFENASQQNKSIISKKASKEISRKVFLDIYSQALKTTG